MKIVFNSVYGGFGLSDEATELLYKLKNIEYTKELSSSGSFYYKTNPRGIIYDIPRHDKDLIKVIEDLGDKANGKYADLKIVNIKGNKYVIEEYDGSESVLTPEDINWIIKENNE